MQNNPSIQTGLMIVAANPYLFSNILSCKSTVIQKEVQKEVALFVLPLDNDVLYLL